MSGSTSSGAHNEASTVAQQPQQSGHAGMHESSTGENIIDLGSETPAPLQTTVVPTPPTVESPSKLTPPSPNVPSEPTLSSSSSLAQPTPHKSRSNSTLHSSRPAPPSPAPSRPGSQVFSPQLLAANFPSPSRDRSYSTSSSRGRRVSNSSHPSRASSKPRPRSTLGGPAFNAGDETDSGAATPTGEKSSTATPLDPSLATLPEDIAQPVEKKREEDRIEIRDYAFPPSDPRFKGPGYPLTTEENVESRRSSRWGGHNESPDPISASSSSRKGSGWSGFGLLSWRGLIGRRRGSAASTDDSPAEDEEDYRLGRHVQADHYEDDYAFSESEPASEEEEVGEPWGFYKAAFAFEAVGEHEIGLEEGDLVEVRGRGGGEGWVVAVKRRMDGKGRVVRLDEAGEGEGREGLVPESYLEKAGDLEIAPPTERVKIAEEPTTSPIQEEKEWVVPLGNSVQATTERVSEEKQA